MVLIKNITNPGINKHVFDSPQLHIHFMDLDSRARDLAVSPPFVITVFALEAQTPPEVINDDTSQKKWQTEP